MRESALNPLIRGSAHTHRAVAVAVRVSELAARMRAAGARVGSGEVIAAHRALAAVDPARREDAYHALRATLCASRSDLTLFDGAFRATFGAETPEATPLDEVMEAAREVLPRVALPGSPAPGAAEPTPVPAAWSQEEILRERDFGQYSDAERAAARVLLARLARRGARRSSRRTRPTRRRRGVHDMRGTLRHSVRHGGELVELRYRMPTQRERPLVLVVDVSGSMAPYARMLLQYAQAAVTARRRVEAFAFGTRLTRVTRELRGRDPDAALARATAAIADLGGGTRIGDALAELNRTHGRRLGRGADVVILSDGWDRGDPERLATEMARLRRCAHRVVWLNPLAADPAFEPLTRGLQAALPHTDRLLAGNSIASLERLAELLECVR